MIKLYPISSQYFWLKKINLHCNSTFFIDYIDLYIRFFKETYFEHNLLLKPNVKSVSYFDYQVSKISSSENFTERIMAYNKNISSKEDDGEISVLYNHKEERSKKAIEIVIDSDEDEAAGQSYINCTAENSNESRSPSRSSDNSNPTPSGILGNNESNCQPGSSENSDFIPLDGFQRRPNRSTAVNRLTIPLVPTVAHSQLNVKVEQEINPADVELSRSKLESCRFWEYTHLGCELANGLRSSKHQVFSVLSYNVLSQDLLEDHIHLYQENDRRALNWAHRSEILLKEFALMNADILCLQEVQQTHMETFFNRLNGLGYAGVYKQRTGKKVDGVAIYFKKSMFSLVEHSSVEYYQPGVSLLNRDNVGLVAKLKLNCENSKQLVVATTHLLFNPKRHDVKLAQVQLLLAEVERFSYIGDDRRGEAVYCPSIITGDMNFTPHSGVYNLLTTGMLRYVGLSRKNLLDMGSNALNYTLLPSELEITDTCQHYSLLLERPKVSPHKVQEKNLKLYHSDTSKYRSLKDYVQKMKLEGYVNNFTPRPHTPRLTQSFRPDALSPEGFGTGQLSHRLNLRSAYNHGMQFTDSAEVTTRQTSWVNVDYIFYGCTFSEHLGKVIEGDLKLISRLRLPRLHDSKRIGPIPNLAAPSDHFPLAVVFLYK